MRARTDQAWAVSPKHGSNMRSVLLKRIRKVIRDLCRPYTQEGYAYAVQLV